MKIMWIEHDNGIKGQHGFSDEEIFLDSEIETIIEKYKNRGITVYRWGIFQ